MQKKARMANLLSKSGCSSRMNPEGIPAFRSSANIRVSGKMRHSFCHALFRV